MSVFRAVVSKSGNVHMASHLFDCPRNRKIQETRKGHKICVTFFSKLFVLKYFFAPINIRRVTSGTLAGVRSLWVLNVAPAIFVLSY